MLIINNWEYNIFSAVSFSPFFICAGNWLRTVTSDQTAYSNSSLSLRTRWNRNYSEVINWLFGLLWNILETERVLQFWNKKKSKKNSRRAWNVIPAQEVKNSLLKIRAPQQPGLSFRIIARMLMNPSETVGSSSPVRPNKSCGEPKLIRANMRGTGWSIQRRWPLCLASNFPPSQRSLSVSVSHRRAVSLRLSWPIIH